MLQNLKLSDKAKAAHAELKSSKIRFPQTQVSQKLKSPNQNFRPAGGVDSVNLWQRWI